MASSANFKHFQAQRINTFTLPVSASSLTYYLQESESGSVIFVNQDIDESTIYLPRLNGHSEDAGINFKFIFIHVPKNSGTEMTIQIKKKYPKILFDYYQSNIEGELIDYIHKKLELKIYHQYYIYFLFL